MADIKLFELVEKELELIDEEIIGVFGTDIDLLFDSATHLLKAGGKKVRPAFVLLCAHLYTDDLARIVKMASAIEMIHISSLVHDDVIDNSATRRGRETVRARWGNRVSLFTGNYTLARSLALIALYDREDVVRRVADASMLICLGEIKQMESCHDVSQGFKSYLRRISRKTALLISLSCEIGALICDAPPEQVEALKKYGYYLGMAFQITDDILDIVADEAILGKPVGSDMRQGVITLPAIYAMKFSAQKDLLSDILSKESTEEDDIKQAIDIILDSGGIDYAYACASRYAELARRELEKVPDAPARQNLENISRYITGRES